MKRGQLSINSIIIIEYRIYFSLSQDWSEGLRWQNWEATDDGKGYDSHTEVT